MPDESPSNAPHGPRQWVLATSVDRLASSKPIAVKLNGLQIALFVHRGEVLACNNRCPHEGYPLVEGALDDECVLTCNWHNWKFDLKTGATLYGGDQLRVYPVSVRDGSVYVDIAELPAAHRIDEALSHLDAAIADFDSPRIARELARLAKAGAEPDVALERAIVGTHDKLRDGMSHAYAAAETWFRLRETLDDDAMRLACATEALAYIAFDTLREKSYPYSIDSTSWSAPAFAAAVESQDEARAIALVDGALRSGLDYTALEPTLAHAALAHYNDFGHSLIYLDHVGRLIARLGAVAERPLLKAWVRSLVLATREDLLPDFRGYAEAVAAFGSAQRTRSADGSSRRVSVADIVGALEGQPVRAALKIVVEHACVRPTLLHSALMETAARHLLRFDEAHALRTGNSVADNVGWLDFSHALTFGHSLRRLCERHPDLWAQGLLQLTLFCARNNTYLDPALSSTQALTEWAVDDEDAFHRKSIARIVDHGIGVPILAAHWLKTWSAVRETLRQYGDIPSSTRSALLAATSRLLAVNFKQRHPLRTARQALRFIDKED